MSRVVVVGAGFGGLNLARELRRKPVEVVLIDRHNYHLFQPLLYQVATAGLEPGEIAYPIRRIVHGYPNVHFRMAEVQRIELDRRCLQTSSGEVPYDVLVLAGGSDANFFGMQGLASRSFPLKDLAGAVRLRNHILTRFERAAVTSDAEERVALLTFVIGGGGPTGVECAGALAELVTVLLRRDYHRLHREEVRIHVVEAEPELLGMVRPRLRRAALRQLQVRRVEVHLATHVRSYDGQRVELSAGQSLACRTLVWAAGVRASDVAAQAGIAQARGGRLPVGPTLQVEGHPEVFVIGDMAYREVRPGQPLPQLAPVAIQQAKHVARTILGAPPAPFKYFDKGTLATIGRRAAVAQFGPLGFSGALAWCLWLVVHLVMLIGFRNRAAVLMEWIWNYVRYDQAIRLITDE